MSYYFPAEWQPQSGIMLTWPHINGYWDPILPDVRTVFCDIIREIAAEEKVLLVCQDLPNLRSFLQEKKVNVSNIRFFDIPTNDVWARDHGPITVFDKGKPLLLDFTFNAWGNKYNFPLDNLITRRLYEAKAFPTADILALEFILEGGSIETDGQGTLLTTRRCLLEKGRNKNYTEAMITDVLKKQLGVEQVLWLSEGYLPGDDTDAHIDTLARFTDPNTIAYQSCTNPNDEIFTAFQAMAAELANFKSAQGNPYKLVALPNIMPKHSRLTGNRLPASYANFLITNKKVIVPIYDDPSDETALNILARCFPTRKIVGINSLFLIENFGSIHCISMQLPEGVLV